MKPRRWPDYVEKQNDADTTSRYFTAIVVDNVTVFFFKFSIWFNLCVSELSVNYVSDNFGNFKSGFNKKTIF